MMVEVYIKKINDDLKNDALECFDKFGEFQNIFLKMERYLLK